MRQLQYLWSKPIVTCLFGQLLRCSSEKQSLFQTSQSVVVQNDLARSIQSNVLLHEVILVSVHQMFTNNIKLVCGFANSNYSELWKKFNKIRAEAQANEVAQQLPALSITAVVCQLYQNALLTLNSLHTNILSGKTFTGFIENKRNIFGFLIYFNCEKTCVLRHILIKFRFMSRRLSSSTFMGTYC